MTRTQLMMTKSKIRRSRRGAALVEAALLFPVMVLFIVYLTYFNNIHKVEFAVMAEARRQAWDQASHGCTGGATGGQTNSTDSSGSNTTNAQGGQTGTVMKGIIPFALGNNKADADSGPYPTKFAPRTITHDVYVPCNEDVNASDSIFTQFIKLAKTMGKGIL